MLYEGILGLHSLLRWILLILLIVNIIRVNIESKDRFDETDMKFSFWMTIFTWLNLIAAIDLYLFGHNGISIMKEQGYSMKDVLNSEWLRFWIIEHPSLMLIALSMLIVSHSICMRNFTAPTKHKVMNILYVSALLLIIIAIPWPFRMEGIARPVFRGLS